jgi:hemoglobin
MQSVYEAAGGTTGLLALANAWRTRVMEDDVAKHTFSHGFHPERRPGSPPDDRRSSAPIGS